MPDLHEHAETSLQQVCEAPGHVLDVGTFVFVRMKHHLQDLPQERAMVGLQRTEYNTRHEYDCQHTIHLH